MPIIADGKPVLTADELTLLRCMNRSGDIGALHFDGPQLQDMLTAHLSHGGHYVSAAGRMMTYSDISGLSPKRT